MVRRWSCLNTFNFEYNYNSFLLVKFNVLKLLKAVNYKRYTVLITKFNRHKLAKWKRQSIWLIYTEILKHWIRDYNIFKKLAKFQFSNNFFLNSVIIYDFKYVKKRNPLNYSEITPFFINSFTKFFLYYYYKMYSNHNSLSFLWTMKNNNFISINSLNFFSPIVNDAFSILIKSQSHFYSNNFFLKKKKKLSFFFYNWTLRNVLYTYKIFNFLYFFFIFSNVK